MHERPSGKEGPLVVFSGGGTGGHLYPALALADALEAVRPDVRSLFVGARRGLESRVLPSLGRDHLLVDVYPLSRGSVLRSLVNLARTVGGVRAVSRFVRERRPRLIVVTGGYASVPAAVAARRHRVPLVVQEQNALPGVAARLAGRWADRVHVAYVEAVDRLPARARSRARLSGNPIRTYPAREAAVARTAFGLAPAGLVALVLGGSQGSRALNERMADAVAGVAAGHLVRPAGLQVLWQTGTGHIDAVKERWASAGAPDWVRPVAYIDDMGAALAASNLAVARAGAVTTSEFMAAGLPSILVPLPTSAEGHQAMNAEALAAAGVAEHRPEAQLDGPGLWRAVTELAGDPDRLARMARAALERARPEAAREIAADLARILAEAEARVSDGTQRGTGRRGGGP